MKQIPFLNIGIFLIATVLAGHAQLAKTSPRVQVSAPGAFVTVDDSEVIAVDRTRTLVIPQKPAEPKDLAQTEEDLNVMARILEKASLGSSSTGKHAMGISI